MTKDENLFEKEVNQFWREKYGEIKSELNFRKGRKPKRKYEYQWSKNRKKIRTLYIGAVKKRAKKQHLKPLIVHKSKKYKIDFHRGRRWGRDIYKQCDYWLNQKANRLYKNHAKLYLNNKPHIYLFWKGHRCVYIGRTLRYDISGGGGKWDLRNWREANRLQIYFINTIRNLPKAECLAKDIFDPYQNRIKPSQPRYTSKCPIHEDLRHIDHKLKYLSKM